MLNFLISTIAFSLAMYGMNRYFEGKSTSRTRSRSMLIMLAATLTSIGAGMAIDRLDGEAELHKKDPSLIEMLKSGDSLQIAKVLTGFD